MFYAPQTEIKPRNIGSIPKKEKKILCNGLQLSQLVRSNFVHFDLLLFVMILSRGIYLLFFFEYERVTSTLQKKTKETYLLSSIRLNALAKAFNLIDDKRYVYQYMRKSKTYYQR